MKVKATISIHRFSGSSSGISITLRDEVSGCEFFRGEMNAEDFGNAVTGLSEQPIEGNLATANVNKKREVKEEVVPYQNGYQSDQKEAKRKQEALAPFEVDGWRGRKDDLGNQHRGTGNGYRVTFIRFVDI